MPRGAKAGENAADPGRPRSGLPIACRRDDLESRRGRDGRDARAGNVFAVPFGMTTEEPQEVTDAPPATRRRPRRFRRALALLLFCALFAGASAWTTCGFRGCPDVDRLASFRPGGAPVLLDRAGKPFARLTPVRRELVPLRALPRHVAEAFIAIEDQRFRRHRGVDWWRLAGALLADLRSQGFHEGFSTITMQLARNVFPETIPAGERTARRKLVEIKIARAIERRFTKDAILELYVNHIYFGNGVRGIAAAAEEYFGVPAERLTLPQAALLAALPKAPTHYDPRRHPKAARARRDLVLARMAEQGRISHQDARTARAAALGIVAPHPRPHDPGFAPYFVEEVRRRLEARFGDRTYAEPLRIHTTLDAGAQRAAEEELARQLAAVERGELGRFRGPRYSARAAPPLAGTAYLQGAVVALDAEHGDVLAWVGGRDFRQSQFDRVIGARRQAGSAFKPFVYAAAIAKGWALSQPILDRPLEVPLPNGEIWEPRNFVDRYRGRLSVREALMRSSNVATVRLARAVGYQTIAELAERAGIAGPLDQVPAMPLGTVAVSPLELGAAYTAFATLGDHVDPRLILSVESADGRTLWRAETVSRRVINPGVAFLVTDALRDALDAGSGRAARRAGFRGIAAAKTGTTNDATDAWFVGFTPEVVAAVWIGFDQPRSIGARASGGRLAGPVWGRMMARLYRARRPSEPWPLPRSVRVLPVDPATGLVVATECLPPGGTRHREIFLVGLEPATFCPGRERVPTRGFATDVPPEPDRRRAGAERAPPGERRESGRGSQIEVM